MSTARTIAGEHAWVLGYRSAHPSTKPHKNTALCHVCVHTVFDYYVQRTKGANEYRVHLCCGMFVACSEDECVEAE